MLGPSSPAGRCGWTEPARDAQRRAACRDHVIRAIQNFLSPAGVPWFVFVNRRRLRPEAEFEHLALDAAHLLGDRQAGEV
ncbi:MAG: hypothetical protein L6Q92_06530, partial [Phycisphaerae bacterium]|nr:hypothetical protein [Phycisphaerae bacterium]